MSLKHHKHVRDGYAGDNKVRQLNIFHKLLTFLQNRNPKFMSSQ